MIPALLRLFTYVNQMVVKHKLMLTPPLPYRLRPLQLDDLDTVQVIEKLSMPTPTRDAVYRYEIVQNRLAHYQALTIQTQGEAERVIGYAGYWLMA